MSIKAFGAMLEGQGHGCSAIGKALAAGVGVPYHTERESERCLGHRLLNGHPESNRKRDDDVEYLPRPLYRLGADVVETVSGDPPSVDGRFHDVEQLTEEVWTRDNWPDSCNSVALAVAKLLEGIIGVYYHRPSMNLVLVGPQGEKVGIRSTALVAMGEILRAQCEPLGRLRGYLLASRRGKYEAELAELRTVLLSRRTGVSGDEVIEAHIEAREAILRAIDSAPEGTPASALPELLREERAKNPSKWRDIIL